MRLPILRIASLLVLLSLVSTSAAVAQQPQPPAAPQEVEVAQADAFSYQGYLESGGSPVNQSSPPGCDFIVTLYGSSGGADVLGVAETRLAVPVNKGYFTLTDLDFDTTFLFRGDERYLSIQVRCPGGTGAYTTLSPRQKILPVPYAAMATKLTSFNPNNRDASVNLNWFNDGTNDWPRIRYGGNGEGSGNGFKIQGSGDRNIMTMLDNGNIGLGAGNTNPGALLDLAGGSILLDDGQSIFGNTISGNRGFIKLYNTSTGNLELGTTFPTGGIQFTAGNALQMTLQSDGDLGLGVASPGAHLEVYDDGSTAAELKLQEPTAGQSAGMLFQSPTRTWELGGDSSPDIFYIQQSGGNQSTFAIDTAGNVGIGTSTPQARLDARSSDVILQSGKDLGTISWYGSTANLYQFASTTDASQGQSQAGFGFVMAPSIISPIVWMYSGADNGFQVLKKGFAGTVQTGTKLFEVTAAGNSWTYGTASSKVVEIRGGSDFAEPFDIAGSENVQPGMVVAIDPEHPGQLAIADQPYLRTVAGCVSGANGIQPGLVMQQEGTAASGEFPVALSGRVYCMADASFGPIQPGDLLTTSATPGHVMVVSPQDLTQGKAFGAILGKAMSALPNGQGLVLVLVTLQ